MPVKYLKGLFAFFLLHSTPARPRLFPPRLLSSSRLTRLVLSASGVDPLILAWQRGEDTDGTLLVNLICKSKCVCFPSVFSRPPLSHLDPPVSASPQTADTLTPNKRERLLNYFWSSESSFSVKTASVNDFIRRLLTFTNRCAWFYLDEIIRLD